MTQLMDGCWLTARCKAARAILPFSGSFISAMPMMQPVPGSINMNQPLLESFTVPSFRGLPPRAGGASLHLVAIFSCPSMATEVIRFGSMSGMASECHHSSYSAKNAGPRGLSIRIALRSAIRSRLGLVAHIADDSSITRKRRRAAA